MLKRLRPASPPPFVPLVSGTLPFDKDARRNSKRRRLSTPTLDGRVRGWGGTNSADDIEDEDSISNEEFEGELSTSSHASEYKHANNILHELHTLHQHRLLFSSTSSHPSNPHIHNHSTSTPSPTPDFDCSNRPSKMDITFHSIGQITHAAPDLSAKADASLHVTKDEALWVKERYGDVNRLLGSLFLSRRRQLDAAVDSS